MSRSALRTFVLALACAGLTLLIAPPANASTVTCPDGTVFTVGATDDAFTIRALCADHQQPAQTAPPEPVDDSPSESAGTWIYDGPVCDNAGICASTLLCADGTPMTKYYFLNADGERGATRTVCPGDPDDPGPTITPPTPGEIFSAFKQVAPTEATLSIQPPGGQTLVNFETIFSTVAEPFSTGKKQLTKGFTVQFDVRPTAFTWKFGDGTELATDWAGEPWAAGKDVSTLINHVYTAKKPVTASVTVTWGADVRLNGGAPAPVDGTVDVTSPAVPLEILEAKPTLVR